MGSPRQGGNGGDSGGGGGGSSGGAGGGRGATALFGAPSSTKPAEPSPFAALASELAPATDRATVDSERMMDMIEQEVAVHRDEGVHAAEEMHAGNDFFHHS